MTDDDRELLEAAATAAGEVIDRWAKDENGVEYAWLENGDPWQPLHRNTATDCDGDALRLAWALRLAIDFRTRRVFYLRQVASAHSEVHWGEDEDYRRAIVRAAAAAAEAQP